MSHKRRICTICNRYECGGYGHGSIPDHEPEYITEDELYYEPEPQKCQICQKSIPMKNTEVLDTEFYIIAGSYYEEPFMHGYDLEPVYYICTECFREKIEFIWKSKRQDKLIAKDLKRYQKEQEKKWIKNRKDLKKRRKKPLFKK